MKKISLIIPCFNEEDGIKYILKSVPSYIDEIVVVDNNSADNTAKVAGQYGARVVFNLLSGRNVKDSQSGMWVFKKEVLDKIKLKSGGMSLSEEIKMEIILHEDIKFLEVPISYNKRVGETKLRRAKDGLLNLFFLVKKRIEIFFRK